MKFWDVVKEMSAQPVRQEASRLFVLGLAGDPDIVAAARAEALGPDATHDGAAAAAPYLFAASPPYSEEEEKRLRYADLLVSFPGGPAITELRPADTIRVQRVEDLKQRVLEHRPDLRVSLARRLPGFREMASEQVIQDVSRVNAEFAAVAGISGAIPFLSPLFPAVAGADLLMLTKNQVFMILRLAAIHGYDLGLKARSKEIAGVVGSAFGWRALARELAGVLPGALGLPIRAGIAYSGTYAVGRAAQMVFDEGRRPTRAEMARIYEEATNLARDAAARVLEKFGGRKDAPSEPKALPEPSAEPLPSEIPEAVPERARSAAPGDED